MWAYYADDHEGVCLRFQGTPLSTLAGCLPPLRVNYATEFPAVPFYDSTLFRQAQALIATKSEAWKHEREWRIVRHQGHGEVAFPPEALDGVILGCRVS